MTKPFDLGELIARARALTRRGKGVVSVLVIQAFCALLFVGTALLHERKTRLRATDVTLQGRSDSLMESVQDAEDPLDRLRVDPTEFWMNIAAALTRSSVTTCAWKN